MAYYFCSVAAVPSANKEAYTEHTKAFWKLFQKYGATRMVETWGSDVPKGEVTDFYRAVQAKEDETICCGWIEWPDQDTANAAWEKMQSDPEMKAMPAMPLDGKRMIYGSFAPIFDSADA